MALLGLALALEASTPGVPAAKPGLPPWRVLILCGADVHVPAVITLVQSVRSVLSEGAAPRLVTLKSEVVDSLSFNWADYEAELFTLLEKKYHAGRFDLVMPMTDAALRFAERRGEALWPGVPIVAFAVSEEALRDDGFAAVNGTGVAIDFDEAGTLRLARRLQPDAERLLLVAGDSEYDRRW
jgi:hypothetical protein